MTTGRLFGYYVAPPLITLFFLVFSIPHATATTVVVIVNRNGIVVASDSKFSAGSGTTIPKSKEIGRKVLTVWNRFAIVSIGTGIIHIGRDNGRNSDFAFDYDFSAWVQELQDGLPEDASFSSFASAVNIQVKLLVPKLQSVLNYGWIHPKNTFDLFEVFATYVMVGYENGIPKLHVDQIYIDWNSRTVIGPYEIPVELTPLDGNGRAYFYGVRDAATEFGNPKSYAYKRTMAAHPQAFRHLLSRQTLSLDETATLARALVEVEEQTSPDEVGGEVRGIKIFPDGRASDLFDEVSPKAKTGDAKQQKKQP